MSDSRVHGIAAARIRVWGDPVDEAALTQIRRTAEHPAVRGAALMADHHKGYAVPIGGVVAYEGHISPSGVGFDIACGNKAVKTDAKAEGLNIAALMDDIVRVVSFGVGRHNEERVDHDLFDDPAWQLAPVKALRDKAAAQLGTVGSGNHYVDLLEDEDGWLWIGVHVGSRGFGHGVATSTLKAGGASDGMDVDPLVLSVDSALGADYLAGMALAGRYAYAGRDWVCDRVARLVGASVVEEVHNHHNFAWLENHDGRDVRVVRKGATPAWPGQRGFVGGSMGDISVILEGAEHVDDGGGDEQIDSFYSTVHGAGRVMGRMDAKGKVKNGRVVRPPRITKDDMRTWLETRPWGRVELRGSDVDEAPQAYKRLPEVLAHHTATVRILHELKPLGVAMAGAYEFDPYKD